MAGSGASSSDAPDAGQGDLFGGVPPSPLGGARRSAADAEVGAAAADESLARLAAGLPAGLRFGTSSWGFAGWAGLVYDRRQREAQLARQGLGAYARLPQLRALPHGLPYAVEFRDPEMLGADYAALLADVGAVHGACAQPLRAVRPAHRSGPGRAWCNRHNRRWRTGVRPRSADH